MLIDIIAGARPNFMKIAPIIRELDSRRTAGGPLRYRLVHTGQHYDARMSGDFFTQLGIPAPDVNLEVGSGTQAEQTAAIMVRYEKLLLGARSALCLVVGDVTSTMACAIAAQKLCVPVSVSTCFCSRDGNLTGTARFAALCLTGRGRKAGSSVTPQFEEAQRFLRLADRDRGAFVALLSASSVD